MKAAVAVSSQVISSSANPLLKEIRRAVRQGTVTSNGCMVAESFHLLEEALRSGRECRIVLASETAQSRASQIIGAAGRDVPLRIVTDAVFNDIASTETTQGVMALVAEPSWTLDDLFRKGSVTVILDGLQDPGNAGAIARAAEAFGAGGILFVRGSVSPVNPKTLRASAGSLFRLPYVSGLDHTAVGSELRRRSLQLVAASSDAGDSPDQLDWTLPTALLIGSEAHGVSPALLRGARPVRIATQGVESLNASVAAAVLLYEASRQRTASGAASGRTP